MTPRFCITRVVAGRSDAASSEVTSCLLLAFEGSHMSTTTFASDLLELRANDGVLGFVHPWSSGHQLPGSLGNLNHHWDAKIAHSREKGLMPQASSTLTCTFKNAVCGHHDLGECDDYFAQVNMERPGVKWMNDLPRFPDCLVMGELKPGRCVSVCHV